MILIEKVLLLFFYHQNKKFWTLTINIEAQKPCYNYKNYWKSFWRLARLWKVQGATTLIAYLFAGRLFLNFLVNNKFSIIFPLTKEHLPWAPIQGYVMPTVGSSTPAHCPKSSSALCRALKKTSFRRGSSYFYAAYACHCTHAFARIPSSLAFLQKYPGDISATDWQPQRLWFSCFRSGSFTD